MKAEEGEILDVWMACLAGAGAQPIGQGNGESESWGHKHVMEAAMLRSLLLQRSWPLQGGEPMPDSEALQWSRVRHRLHGSSEIGSESADPAMLQALGSRLKTAANASWWGTAAAVCAMAILGVLMLTFPADDQDGPLGLVMRGGPQRQLIEPPPGGSVGTEEARLTALLHQHHVLFRRIALPGGDVQIQAKVPAAVSTKLATELAAMGVHVPANGLLDLQLSTHPLPQGRSNNTPGNTP